MHVASLNTGCFFNNADISHAFNDFINDSETNVPMDYFASPEHHNDLHLVATAKKAKYVFDLKIKVVVISAGSELNLFDYNIFLFRSGCVLPFGFHELIFAVIHNPANRWVGGRGNFYKIQTLVRGNFDCFSGA